MSDAKKRRIIQLLVLFDLTKAPMWVDTQWKSLKQANRCQANTYREVWIDRKDDWREDTP